MVIICANNIWIMYDNNIWIINKIGFFSLETLRTYEYINLNIVFNFRNGIILLP